jgi:hypothetical protein
MMMMERGGKKREAIQVDIIKLLSVLAQNAKHNSTKR